jgi:hypothetical protein
MGWLEEANPAPALFFVHDQGVYLMSNGEPRDIITADGKETTYVAYAEHCNPKTDADWWDNARGLVGGDDFAETILINRTWLEKCGRYEELEINVNGSELSCTFVKPKRIVRVI